MKTAMIGEERTFQLEQFDETKVYNRKIDFSPVMQEEEKSDGVVKITLQYVRDERKLVQNAIERIDMKLEQISLLV